MRKNQANRPPGRPSLARGKRNGGTPDFAQAITRAEFGRFYVDADRLQEATQSVAEAIARRKPALDEKPKARKTEPREKPEAAAVEESAEPPPEKPAKKRAHLPWQPRVRERRTEIATGMARVRRESEERD